MADSFRAEQLLGLTAEGMLADAASEENLGAVSGAADAAAFAMGFEN
ncbi:MAG: hypothetical protein WB611_26810 [Stellaceae bacterium]